MSDIKFTVKYEGFDGCIAAMEPTTVIYGKATKLRKNIFERSKHNFLGWTAHRESDNKTCYVSPDKKRRFFTEGEQPKGWFPCVYKDGGYVSKLSKIDNDTIIMRALWERNDGASKIKKELENRMMNSPVVLFGSFEQCKAFYDRFFSRLNIRSIMIDGEMPSEESIGDITLEPFSADLLKKDDYIIVCHPVKTRLDDLYRNAKRKLTRKKLTFMDDFLRADIASMILEHKDLWIWFGYCQLNTVCNEIFPNIKSVKSQWTTINFRYELDTLSSSYKYDECKKLLTICSCVTYIPLFAAKDKMDFEFDDYLPGDAKKISVPRIPFGGYYPWREKDSENFYKFHVDEKLHWPFAYQEKIIDDLILKGLSDEEIYSELMREDLFTEKEIKRKLKMSYKLIEISEKTCDIKILDFIKDNIDKRRVYRDGLHYQNFMYFELARRIAACLGVDCIQEIDELEKRIAKSGRQYIDYTEVPILPCVAKVLGLDFINEETIYRVRFTEKGAWRGTRAVVKRMDIKEWIYTYIKYTRAAMTIREMWLLDNAEPANK